MTISEEKVCERFKEIRRSLKLKQGEFAKEIKLTQGHVSDIENKRKNVSDRVIEIICLKYGINEDWLRTGAGGDDNMFVKISKDEELAMYTQRLLDSTDDVVADMIKEIIIMYEKLDNDSKQVLKNVTKGLLDKMNIHNHSN